MGLSTSSGRQYRALLAVVLGIIGAALVTMAIAAPANAATARTVRWSATATTPPAGSYATACAGTTCYFATPSSALGQGPDSWSLTGRRLTAVPRAGDTGPDYVSCWAVGACRGVDFDGSSYTLTSAGWSAPTRVLPSITPYPVFQDISCSSASFCMASIYGRHGAYAVWDGAAWSTHTAPLTVSYSGFMGEVSCPADGWCLAGFGVELAVYRNGTWTQWVTADDVAPSVGPAVDAPFTNQRVSSVACGAADQCVASFGDGAVSSFDGATWTVPAKPAGYAATSVVCAPSSANGPLCLANTTQGAVVTYNSAGWGGATTQLQGMTAVKECSASTCVGLTPSGTVVRGTVSR